MSRAAHLHVQDANGQWVPWRIGNETGFVGGTGGGGNPSSGVLPSGTPQTIAPWYYAAGAGGLTTTDDATLIAAAGAGKANYLTSLQLINKHATVGTEVVVKSASTVLWRGYVPPLGATAANFAFSQPLIGANNTALTAACVTAGAAVLINAQGYQDQTLEMLKAQLTDEIEVFTAGGDPLLDGAGNQITIPYYAS